MAKKGKGKKSGGKAKKTKEKVNPREAFIEARLEFRREQLKSVHRELKELEEEVQFSVACVNDSDRHRTSTINGILSKLHLVERSLGENCLNNESELRQSESNYHSKAATRKRVLENAQGQLDAEWARNREIEDEIREWTEYRNVQSKSDAARIESLETDVQSQNQNTQSVIDFINNQIKNSQSQYDQRQEAAQEKMRHDAFEEAFRCTSPGAFYECRESERLQKYCDDHQKLLSNEVDLYQSVLQKKSRLINQLKQLKQSQLERPRQLQPVLDSKYFLTI